MKKISFFLLAFFGYTTYCLDGVENLNTNYDEQLVDQIIKNGEITATIADKDNREQYIVSFGQFKIFASRYKNTFTVYLTGQRQVVLPSGYFYLIKEKYKKTLKKKSK
jgi:hypothetical protein